MTEEEIQSEEITLSGREIVDDLREQLHSCGDRLREVAVQPDEREQTRLWDTWDVLVKLIDNYEHNRLLKPKENDHD